MGQKLYRLSKSRQILRIANNLYKRKWKRLNPDQLTEIESLLSRLDRALLDRNRQLASDLSHQVAEVAPQTFDKTLTDYSREILTAILFALVVATVWRQMWFEPMRIPSGSMRPTFQELDRLVATKDTFGLNIPLTTGHFVFDPDLVNRTGVIIFTAQDMEIADQDTTYFFLFPGKKRLIKRCMGKPGDSLYFYGGKIYGVDRDGNDLPILREGEWMKGIDAVPFISFEGGVTAEAPNARNIFTPVYLHQMNQPIARLSWLPSGTVRGELNFNGKWIPEGGEVHYSDFFGMRNYAMVRLLTKGQLTTLTSAPTEGLGQGDLYLELRHNPSLTYPRPRLGRDLQGRIRPMLIPETSAIALNRDHLNALFDALYTSRFVVRDGYATPDQLETAIAKTSTYRPYFPDVPDGRYQFQDGIAYEVAFSGILRKLPSDHPLYDRSLDNIQKLFNLGIEFNTLYGPQTRDQIIYPQRFAWFNHGDLCIMGAPILKEGDPILTAFNTSEQERVAASRPGRTYTPFKDWGPPTDAAFIRTYGYTLPDDGYLALGDNYSSSSDSRAFGPVPQDNLRGDPAVILWPPGKRWGLPKQAPYKVVSLPRLIVWGVVIVIAVVLTLVRRRRNSRPQFIKRSP